ncbi:MAG TPA: hypothetical protein PK156_46995, partial [Polyangium sp.]|nr:hypothetical protein [Polyangium sp.]
PSPNIVPSVPPTPVDVLIAPAPPARRPAPTIVSTARRSPVSSSFWWMWIAICVGVFLLSAGVVALVFSGDEPSNAAPRPSSVPSAKR